jgi:hypothetical protein
MAKINAGALTIGLQISYKSKSVYVNSIYGLIKYKRNTNKEFKEDMAYPEPRNCTNIIILSMI